MKKKDIVIKVEDIDKSFKIKKNNASSVKEVFTHPWKLFENNTQDFNALSDISFKVERGDFVGIIGRNGSGKSTLLKILAGIFKPDRGRISIDGKIVPFLELGVGFNPELSARENIFLNGTILGMSKRYLDKKLDEIVKFAEVKEFINTPVKNFSSGMMLKLAFAIAVQSDAEIFLLDEILSVGDAVFQRKSEKIIKKFIRSGKTILYVSHNLSAVEKYANKVLWLHKGRIRFWGDALEGVDKYKTYTFNLERKELEKSLRTKKKHRLGNLEVKPQKVFVKYLDNQDIEITAILKYNKNVRKLNVAFGIYNRQDHYVFAVSTQMDKIKLNLKTKKVKLILKRPMLLPGQYYVNIAIFGNKEAEPYAWQREIATFLVPRSVLKGFPSFKYRGCIYLDHKWEYE